MNEENLQNPQTPQNQSDGSASQRLHVTETPQKAIRTYESDVADVLAHKNISTAKIALAENKRQTGEERLGSAAEESTQNSGTGSQGLKKALIALVSLLLLAGGGGTAYYLYSISPLAQVATPSQQTSAAATSIIPSDGYSIVAIDNMSPNQIISALKKELSKPTNTNTIQELILVKSVNGQRVRVTGPDMAKIMDLQAPDILLRALADSWMIGIYTDSQGQKDLFIVATNDYFQNAFAGMLQWESTMPDDLKQYVYSNPIADIANGALSTPDTSSTASVSSTTMSTTTPATSSTYAPDYNVLRGSFVDRIIRNKDVREFVTDSGPLFLYSFIDNSKLVVTSKESTLNAIFDRLEQKAFVR